MERSQELVDLSNIEMLCATAEQVQLPVGMNGYPVVLAYTCLYTVQTRHQKHVGS